MSSSNRVAIVTGGSGALGRAVASRLAEDGLSVVVAFAGHQARADEVVAEITSSGGSASSFRADVAEEEDVRALFDHAEARFGGVDVVVNAAGIMILKPVAELDLEDFDRMHRTNVRGTFVVMREAARRVRAGGAVIHFSSSVTKLAGPTYSAYAASKGAVEAATLIFARELRGRDVTVNTVAPGPMATPMFLDGKSEAQIAAATKAAPLERLGAPGDVAEVVSSLAGEARWINGQILYVNGGIT
jgi:3-oxoacyl-[acyl-carrier protein] reductase